MRRSIGRTARRYLNEHFQTKNQFADGRNSLSREHATLDSKFVPTHEVAKTVAEGLLTGVDVSKKSDWNEGASAKYEIFIDGVMVDTSERYLEAGGGMSVDDYRLVELALDDGREWTVNLDRPYDDGYYSYEEASEAHEDVCDSLARSLENHIRLGRMGRYATILPGTYSGRAEVGGRSLEFVFTFSRDCGVPIGYFPGMPKKYDYESREEYAEKRGRIPSPVLPESVERGGEEVICGNEGGFGESLRKVRIGTPLGESVGRARDVAKAICESKYVPTDEDLPPEEENSWDVENNNLDYMNKEILRLKDMIGWNPVGGVSLVSGSFKPKYGGDSVPFKPMSLEQFINSAYHCCTAEAHDEVRASTVLVGGPAYIADYYTFSGLLKDGDTLYDYPEYYMHEVALSFNSYYGILTLVELLHDSYYGHCSYIFPEPNGRDYILSKILSSYPFLRDYVDNSDKRFIKFNLPPTMSNEIIGAANKDAERPPTLKSLEDEERNYYGTYDSETGHYDSKYNIDVKNAYKERFGGGKDYVG